MRKIVKLEIVFGLFSLFLIYIIIASNASITGFVVGASPFITLVAPAEYTETQSAAVSFIFKYSPEFTMQECSLKLNEQVVKTINSLLSPYDTRIKKDLGPGTYFWSIECIDVNGYAVNSETRKITIIGEEEGELKVTRFFGDRIGTVYEFELREGLELEIPGTVPNDVIRAKQGKNYYEISLLRISQDYSKNLEFVDLIITPGEKRLNIFKGDSKLVDFNNDGINDLSLLLNDISYRKATFTVSTKQLVQPSSQTTSSESSSQPVSTTAGKATQTSNTNPTSSATPYSSQPSNSKPSASLPWIPIIIIATIALVGVYLVRKNKKESEQAYVGSLKKNPVSQNSAKKLKKPLGARAGKGKR
ncbi:hypothetical protein JXB28_05435 [Candidatus Woesearchaeota archaeon]|nr:hypothetical protein [Candidatus Woesearchaeota archaeon]